MYLQMKNASIEVITSHEITEIGNLIFLSVFNT